MNKLLIVMMVLLAPLSVVAAKTECDFPAEMVKQAPPPNTATIATHYWESGRDKRSDEYLKTLHIIYINGDHAVIQHKYCSMYNFEVAYFRSKQADDLDEVAIAKIVTGLYTYAAKKVTFSRPLEDVISASLKKDKFDSSKDIRIGLPSEHADYSNERVEYSIRYKSLYRSSSIYSSVITFYLGIGGVP